MWISCRDRQTDQHVGINANIFRLVDHWLHFGLIFILKLILTSDRNISLSEVCVAFICTCHFSGSSHVFPNSRLSDIRPCWTSCRTNTFSWSLLSSTRTNGPSAFSAAPWGRSSRLRVKRMTSCWARSRRLKPARRNTDASTESSSTWRRRSGVYRPVCCHKHW